ncbi:cytochrome oxidase c assembly-domain-containing protein [Stachybotrys elegans]|uniref:Cytochrome oxidase c assembly-domain-containing protein n=1 Tax=Stachybotrys elegans TaxID=80388 RepID=A0A8K0SPT8_9HYPO|nr:cytochrome oxidase c assembly-domain-containing protein [Stachybotrys elegans]
MASRIGPRTVKDATRFTSTIPHATSKSAAPSSIASSASSPVAAAARKPLPRIPGETPEQRVRRLREAHLAAQRAQVSTLDRVIDSSRRILDVVHRWTVGGIVLFTVVATIVSIYSVWDMLRYNRARRAEWVETQKKLEADELATARIAYLKGTATPEQIELVEDANLRAMQQGTKLPPLLAPPEHRTHFEEHIQPTFRPDSTPAGAKEEKQGKGVAGLFSGLFGGAKAAQEEVKEATTSAVQAVEAKAKDAWQSELQNQRQGGSLDQLGLESGSSSQTPSKKGWWPW